MGCEYRPWPALIAARFANPRGARFESLGEGFDFPHGDLRASCRSAARLILWMFPDFAPERHETRPVSCTLGSLLCPGPTPQAHAGLLWEPCGRELRSPEAGRFSAGRLLLNIFAISSASQ